MLLDPEAVAPLLRCPRTGAPLRREGDALVAGPNGARYPVRDGRPVLVDFDDSILTPEAVGRDASPVQRPRHGRVAGALKRLVSPPPGRTAARVARLLDLACTGQAPARILVVGGGSIGQGLAALYRDPRVELVAFDIYATPQVQFVADAHCIPLADSCVDAVVVQAVLEHVLEPARVVAEIARVLTPDGLVYAETPFLQPVHEGPWDFTRFTESGHRWLFRDFLRIDSGATAGAGTQLLGAIDLFVRGLTRSHRAGKLAKLLFCWLAWCDRLLPEAHNIDAASGVWFLGRRQVTRLAPGAMLAHYRGAQRPAP